MIQTRVATSQTTRRLRERLQVADVTADDADAAAAEWYLLVWHIAYIEPSFAQTLERAGTHKLRLVYGA